MIDSHSSFSNYSIWGAGGDIYERYKSDFDSPVYIIDSFVKKTSDGYSVTHPELVKPGFDEYLIVFSLESYALIRLRAIEIGYHKERIICISDFFSELPTVVCIEAVQDFMKYSWIKIRAHGEIKISRPVCIVSTSERLTIDCETYSTIELDGCTLYDDVKFYSGNGGSLYVGNGTCIGFRSVLVCRSKLHIGENCMIGWNTTIMDNDGMFTLTSDSKRTIEDKFYVSIENKCWIGCNCTILKGSTLGNGTVIAAHSLVNTLIAPNSLAGGVPARILKSNISWGAFS